VQIFSNTLTLIPLSHTAISRPYRSSRNVSIKTGKFPLHQQKLPGFVVGFTGSKVFLLQSTSTIAIEVPQSASLHNYIELGAWTDAYKVACLGVTPSDWRALGEASLGAMQVGVARAAFLRAHPLDMRYIELLNHIESARAKAFTQRAGDGGAKVGAATEAAVNAGLLADVVAYSGDYAGAAKLYVRAGRAERAVEMFTDLRLWTEARKFAEDLLASGSAASAPGARVDVSALLSQQAAWCEENGDATAAASIYAGLGAVSRAVALLIDRSLHGPLMDLVRTLPSAPPSTSLLGPSAAPGDAARARADSADSSSSLEADLLAAAGEETVGDLRPDVRRALAAAGAHFSNHGHIALAREVFGKLGDVRSLIHLHTDAGQWAEAHALAAATEADVRASLGLAGSGGGGAGGGGEDGALVSRATPLQLRKLAAAKALVSEVHLRRGLKLASEDRFEEALRAYEAGGRPDKTHEILAQLAESALEEDRFADAALHFQRLARDAHSALEAASAKAPARGAAAAAAAAAAAHAPAFAARARRLSHYADVYAAYAVVHTDWAMPFKTALPQTVFNAARFLLNACVGSVWAGGGAPDGGRARGRLPPRVSVVRILYSLATVAFKLHVYSVASFAFDRLRHALHVPPALRERIDMYALSVLTKPLADPPEHAPTCARCGATCRMLNVSAHAVVEAAPAAPPKDLLRPPPASPPGGALVDDADDVDDDAAFASHWRVASSGDACTSCGASFVRSSCTFELLPLVEFTPAPGVDLESALASLAEDPVQAAARGGASSASAAGWTESTSTTARDAQSLKFSAAAAGPPGGAAAALSGDARFRALAKASATPSAAASVSDGQAAVPPGVVVTPADILRALRPSDVFLVRAPVQVGHSRGGGGGAASVISSGTIQALLAIGALSGRASSAELKGSPPRFFFNTDPLNVNITCCAACGRFFHCDDLENELLVRGGCPSCHAPADVVNI
jgi:intraflagellar transport protein 122